MLHFLFFPRITVHCYLTKCKQIPCTTYYSSPDDLDPFSTIPHPVFAVSSPLTISSSFIVSSVTVGPPLSLFLTRIGLPNTFCCSTTTPPTTTVFGFASSSFASISGPETVTESCFFGGVTVELDRGVPITGEPEILSLPRGKLGDGKRSSPPICNGEFTIKSTVSFLPPCTRCCSLIVSRFRRTSRSFNRTRAFNTSKNESSRAP